uniref:Transmembrane protein n=1 Tax=Rhabditophanes sp. KR3021 TaxID=114890 RepID=A0AC35TIT3_9BILA
MKSLLPHICIALAALCLFAPFISAETSLVDEVKSLDPFKIKDSALACPVPVIGQNCPESNVIYHFRCCGSAYNSCCFRLQDWVTVLLLIMAVLTVLAILINIIRCICCLNR